MQVGVAEGISAFAASSAAGVGSPFQFSGALFVFSLCYEVTAAAGLRWELAADCCRLCGVFPDSEEANAQGWGLRVLWGLSGQQCVKLPVSGARAEAETST